MKKLSFLLIVITLFFLLVPKIKELKKLGGDMVVELQLPKGQKLVIATWKGGMIYFIFSSLRIIIPKQKFL